MGKKNKKRNIEEQVDVNSAIIKNKNTKSLNRESGVNDMVTNKDVSSTRTTKLKKKKNSVKIIESMKNKELNKVLSVVSGDNSDQETDNVRYGNPKKRKHSKTNIDNDVVDDDGQITPQEICTHKNKTKKLKKKNILQQEIHDKDSKVNTVNDDNQIQQETDADKIKKKKRRKNNILQQIINNKDSIVSTVNDDDQIIQQETVIVKNKKKKLKKLQQEVDDVDSHEKIDISIKRKNDKKSKQETLETAPNGDVAHEENTNNDKKSKKKKKRKIVEEEIINDEDIDKYCEELDEVHNKQYEDWVKLLENSLNANKKIKIYITVVIKYYEHYQTEHYIKFQIKTAASERSLPKKS